MKRPSQWLLASDFFPTEIKTIGFSSPPGPVHAVLLTHRGQCSNQIPVSRNEHALESLRSVHHHRYSNGSPWKTGANSDDEMRAVVLPVFSTFPNKRRRSEMIQLFPTFLHSQRDARKGLGPRTSQERAFALKHGEWLQNTLARLARVSISRPG